MHSTIDQALPLHQQQHSTDKLTLHAHALTYEYSISHSPSLSASLFFYFFQSNNETETHKSLLIMHIAYYDKTTNWNQCLELFKWQSSMLHKIQNKITIKSKHWNKHHRNATRRQQRRGGKKPVRQFSSVDSSYGLNFNWIFKRFRIGLFGMQAALSLSSWWHRCRCRCRTKHKSLCYIIHFVCVDFFCVFKARLFRRFLCELFYCSVFGFYQWIPRFMTIQI